METTCITLLLLLLLHDDTLKRIVCDCLRPDSSRPPRVYLAHLIVVTSRVRQIIFDANADC